MPSWDFKCPNNHIIEINFDTLAEAKKTVKCSLCGQKAVRLISLSNPVLGLQNGTYRGEAHQEEVRSAMKEYAAGNPNKKES